MLGWGIGCVVNGGEMLGQPQDLHIAASRGQRTPGQPHALAATYHQHG